MLVLSIVNPFHFGASLQYLAYCFIALKCATCCWQIMFITCIVRIFLTVTPFGVFFTCKLTRISCTLCLCYCFLLLTNLKYGLRQNNTKYLNCCGVLSEMPCLGLCL